MNDEKNDENKFDFSSIFEKATKKVNSEILPKQTKEAMQKLKTHIFEIYDMNAFLEPEESIAIALDVTNEHLPIGFRHLYTVWYYMWKKEKEAAEKEKPTEE